jgi:hypothetical protein
MKILKSLLAGYCLAIAALGLTATTAKAVLIDNGSTTLDTVTGLEWLDVTATIGQSYNDIIGGFGGYIASGYRYANITDMCSLFGSLGDAVPGCLAQTGAVEAISATSSGTLVNLLGDTFLANGPSFFGVTCGVYDDGNAGDGSVGSGAIKANGFNGNCQQAAVGNTVAAFANNVSVNNSGNGFIGSYLVRDTNIPEPGAMALFGLGVIGAGFARRIQTA